MKKWIQIDMTKSENLQQFLEVLKEIKNDGETFTYQINPFFHKFIIDDLKSKGVAITAENINNVVLSHLFNTFDELGDNDKLLILFSYVILSYFLESLDDPKKEAVLKVIESQDVSHFEKSNYKELLNLSTLDIQKSIIIKLLNFKMEEGYEETKAENKALRLWIIKSVIYFILGTISISVLFYIIPYTHNTSLGSAVDLILTKLIKILSLIFLNKS